MNYFGKHKVLGTKITACNYDYVIQEAAVALKKKRTLTIAPIATHPIVEALFNYAFQKQLNTADLIVPDSQYVRWALWVLYGICLPDRVYGFTLLKMLFSMAEHNNWKTCLIGNEINRISDEISLLYPGLLLTESVEMHKKKLSYQQIGQINSRLAKIKPDIIIIGIGSPAQHILMSHISNNKSLIMAVGAALNFITDTKLQAPKWMQDSGFEWFYRFMKEPGRLWKRYLLFGPAFIIAILVQKAGRLLNVANLKSFKSIV